MTTRVRYLNTKFANDPTNPFQLITCRVGQSMEFWNFSAKNPGFLWRHQMTSYLFELSKDWNVSSCGQIQSCKFWCRSKKWFQIFKRLFTDVFQKNAALATPAFLLKTRTQMVKGTNMKKLLLLIHLTPGTPSNHKKLCSIKFKNEERLFHENFFKFCLKDCILRSHHFSAEGTFKHFNFPFLDLNWNIFFTILLLPAKSRVMWP